MKISEGNSEFPRPASSVFEPSKLEHHMAKSDARARAILQIVQQLIDNGSVPLRETHAAIRRGQHCQAAHMLHTLNGSVANLGARKVCELAAELEPLLENNAPATRIGALMEALEQEFALLLASAEQWLRLQREQYGVQVNFSRGRAQKLQELLECLAGNDLRALDLFEELQVHIQENMAAPNFAALCAALQSLDFRTALYYMRPA